MPTTLQAMIQKLGDLPPLPRAAARVLRINADSDSSMDEMRRAISSDGALTAQILRIANSPMFGIVRAVETFSQATMVLGFSTIKSIVIASSAKALFCRGSVGDHEMKLWEHALTAALASRAFCEDLQYPCNEECFLGGLLHDVGRRVLWIRQPEASLALVQESLASGRDLRDLEMDAFGFDHAMVGSAVLDTWKLGASLRNAVRWHHDPPGAPEEDRALTSLVAMGNQLALELGMGLGRPEDLEGATAKAVAILGLGPERLAAHRGAVLARMDRDKSLVKDF
jgi:HD-like signal output (HDOD) protein